MNCDSINLLLLWAHVEEGNRSYNLEGIGLTKTALCGQKEGGCIPKNGCQADAPIFPLLHLRDHGHSAR